MHFTGEENSEENCFKATERERKRLAEERKNKRINELSQLSVVFPIYRGQNVGIRGLAVA